MKKTALAITVLATLVTFTGCHKHKTSKPNPPVIVEPTPTPEPTPPVSCDIAVPPLVGTSRGLVLYKKCNGITAFKVIYYCLRGDTNTVGHTNDGSEEVIAKGWVASHVFVTEYRASENAMVSGYGVFPRRDDPTKQLIIPLPVQKVL